MNKEILLFENDLRKALSTPDARPEFITRLESQLKKASVSDKHFSHQNRRLRPAWMVVMWVVFALAAGILLVGPEKVYAEVLKLLGYIPGIGIVDQSQPIRVLSEPVRVTRDGVTVSVNQALLTTDDTQIEYGVSGVPLSARPHDKSIGCIDQEYILLPDGTTLSSNAPIPQDVNQVTFMIPCIFDTLPNTIPTDWEIPLTFVPLPEDTTVLPVLELTPEITTSTSMPTGEPSGQEIAPFEFNEVIETDDGYILIGWFRPHLANGEQIQVNSVQYLDADGKNVKIDYPQDIDLSSSGMPFGVGDSQWAIHFKTSDLTFPLTIRYAGNVYSRVETPPIEFEFDAGTNPQPGQEWVLNKDFDVAGISFRLVSIRAGESGYSFQFESEPELNGLNIQIEGHQATGGGGGPHTRSLAFEEMPTGKLKLLFSDFYPLKETRTWEGKWQPETLPYPQSTADNATPVCLDANSYSTLPNLPEGLEGWMLLTELNPDRQLVLQSMDGEEVKLTIPQASRGSLSPDGSMLAYPSEAGTAIVDLTSGKTTTLKNVGSYYEPHWSPDGRFIAAVNPSADYGIFITAINGSGARQLTNLGYESIAGWSPDGSLLYFAVPDASGAGFMLRAVNVTTGSIHDLFLLEDSSGKAPYPAVSPDGQWVAYRARDNSSLYIKGMDGSPARLLLDEPTTAISGIVWEQGSHLLGVSLITPQTSDGEIILMQFENCEIYKLPGLHGELEGIFIP